MSSKHCFQDFMGKGMRQPLVPSSDGLSWDRICLKPCPSREHVCRLTAMFSSLDFSCTFSPLPNYMPAWSIWRYQWEGGDRKCKRRDVASSLSHQQNVGDSDRGPYWPETAFLEQKRPEGQTRKSARIKAVDQGLGPMWRKLPVFNDEHA